MKATSIHLKESHEISRLERVVFIRLKNVSNLIESKNHDYTKEELEALNKLLKTM